MMEKANNKMTVGRFIFSSLITILIFPAVILILSGDWLWLEDWIFSLWGFIGVIAGVGRIIGEENMLVNELEGYEEYKKKVTYRLVPFVWW